MSRYMGVVITTKPARRPKKPAHLNGLAFLLPAFWFFQLSCVVRLNGRDLKLNRLGLVVSTVTSIQPMKGEP